MTKTEEQESLSYKARRKIWLSRPPQERSMLLTGMMQNLFDQDMSTEQTFQQLQDAFGASLSEVIDAFEVLSEEGEEK